MMDDEQLRDLTARITARRAQEQAAGITHPAPSPDLTRRLAEIVKPGRHERPCR